MGNRTGVEYGGYATWSPCMLFHMSVSGCHSHYCFKQVFHFIGPDSLSIINKCLYTGVVPESLLQFCLNLKKFASDRVIARMETKRV